MTQTPLLDRLAALDTNTVSGALDFLGLPGATCGLRPLWDCPKIVGRASIVQLGPKQDAAPTVHLISPVIARIATDDRVLVIAGGKDGVSCRGGIHMSSPPSGMPGQVPYRDQSGFMVRTLDRSRPISESRRDSP
ncbi:hypothetical protein [Enterovirga sp.]|uniref:hypothetical protein n=1 Tax=Enterovirga sp. TaxID=2026350 RepID=UPI002D088A0B|nr:hypothetical protein [Enterovirga sp.]HMO29379.1 hypothetical protein [Enterovirga sp.]